MCGCSWEAVTATCWNVVEELLEYFTVFSTSSNKYSDNLCYKYIEIHHIIMLKSIVDHFGKNETKMYPDFFLKHTLRQRSYVLCTPLMVCK